MCEALLILINFLYLPPPPYKCTDMEYMRNITFMLNLPMPIYLIRWGKHYVNISTALHTANIEGYNFDTL